MKQVFSMLAFCLILSFSSGLKAQTSNTGRTYIPYSLACQIIAKAQPPLYNDMGASTPQLMEFYDRGVLTITEEPTRDGKSSFKVEVHGCIIILLLEDLA